MGDVLRHAAACPGLTEITVAPVAQDLGELPFQCGAVNPGLCGGTAYSVADDTDGYIRQTVTEHAGEVEGYGREAPHRLGRSRPPALVVHVPQLIGIAQYAVIPLHGIRPGPCRHIVQMQAAGETRSISKVLFQAVALVHTHLHIRLSAGQPEVAEVEAVDGKRLGLGLCQVIQMIRILPGIVEPVVVGVQRPGGYGESIGAAGLHTGQLGRP